MKYVIPFFKYTICVFGIMLCNSLYAQGIQIEDMNSGKRIYRQSCWVCHGNDGFGRGPGVGTLVRQSADFSGDSTKSQTDAELFRKIKYGYGEMPAFNNYLNDREIHKVLVYIKTFGNK